MNRPNARFLLIVFAALLFAIHGCSSPGPDLGDETGSIDLAVTLPDGSTVEEVQYHITGNGQDLSGSMAVGGPGQTVSIHVGSLPAATGYLITLTATTSTDVSCAGNANFDIVAANTTAVAVLLQCQLTTADGDLVVDGTFNYCPQITSLTVAPLSSGLGTPIVLTSTATDADADPVTFAWTATAGTFANAAAASTTYVCTAVGSQTLTLTVSDGSGCTDTISANVTCVNEGVCGDGTVNAGETCDDGNQIPGDGCDAACQIEPACGDGHVDSGEQCDDGNHTAGDGCSASCHLEVCGNGYLDPGEQCDDGNLTASDGCSATCHVEVCGNGVVDPGEACDDGNTNPSDGCATDCTIPDQCTVCEEANCHNYFDSDVVTECYAAVGNAASGPAAGTPKAQLCVAFLTCAYEHHCAVNGAEECYCGAGVPINTCLTQGGSGVCKAQAEAAAESTAALTIAERFVDPAYAIGNAARLLRCDADFCASDCL